jgi:hypothetical protein
MDQELDYEIEKNDLLGWIEQFLDPGVRDLLSIIQPASEQSPQVQLVISTGYPVSLGGVGTFVIGKSPLTNGRRGHG